MKLPAVGVMTKTKGETMLIALAAFLSSSSTNANLSMALDATLAPPVAMPCRNLPKKTICILIAKAQMMELIINSIRLSKIGFLGPVISEIGPKIILAIAAPSM